MQKTLNFHPQRSENLTSLNHNHVFKGIMKYFLHVRKNYQTWLLCEFLRLCFLCCNLARRSRPNIPGAHKSLVQPGRKQATATELPLLQATQKKIQKVLRPTRSPRRQWLTRWTKNGDLSIVFFSRVGLRTCQHPCNINSVKRSFKIVDFVHADFGSYYFG